MSIADRIRELRESKQWFQKELADKISVSVETIKSWEQKRAVPDSVNRNKLMHVFGIPEASLFTPLSQQDVTFLSQLGFTPDDLSGLTEAQHQTLASTIRALLTTFREQNQHATAPPDKKAACIFIIDDEIQLCRLLAETFRGRGYDTGYAFDGQSAMKQLFSGKIKPAVILLDLKMPKMDGARFLRQLRTINHGAKIIVISAHIGAAAELQAHHAVDGFLTKPFRIEEIVQTVEQVLGA